mmetsp:Transcript_24353/g.67836  ORF Transcript_24353/g.67836 Transcript_24353/m.67836 type:complete len:209 (+) Transcript_24353:481-1107(+)
MDVLTHELIFVAHPRRCGKGSPRVVMIRVVDSSGDGLCQITSVDHERHELLIVGQQPQRIVRTERAFGDSAIAHALVQKDGVVHGILSENSCRHVRACVLAFVVFGADNVAVANRVAIVLAITSAIVVAVAVGALCGGCVAASELAALPELFHRVGEVMERFMNVHLLAWLLPLAPTVFLEAFLERVGWGALRQCDTYASKQRSRQVG